MKALIRRTYQLIFITVILISVFFMTGCEHMYIPENIESEIVIKKSETTEIKSDYNPIFDYVTSDVIYVYYVWTEIVWKDGSTTPEYKHRREGDKAWFLRQEVGEAYKA